MRSGLVVIAMALSFLIPTSVTAKPGSSLIGRFPAAAQQAPALAVLRPQANEGFDDHPIFVQVQVSNFMLISPLVTSAAPTDKRGYIRYQLDDFPALLTAETQVMLGKNLGFGYIPAGTHILSISLRDSAHRPLNPPVDISVPIRTTHPPQASAFTSGDRPGVRSELHSVTDQLEEVHKSLKRIQTGNAGYVPDPRFKNNGSTAHPGAAASRSGE